MRVIFYEETTRNGFTLIELVVVVAFISILTGMVIPIYNRTMSSLRIRNTTQDITSLIRYAQEKAVAESREFRVLLDDEKREISLFRLKSQTIDGEKEFELVGMADGGGVLTLPETIKISRITAGKDRKTGLRYISCYPNGASDPGEIELEPQGRGRQRILIKWTGALGRFEIK